MLLFRRRGGLCLKAGTMAWATSKEPSLFLCTDVCIGGIHSHRITTNHPSLSAVDIASKYTSIINSLGLWSLCQAREDAYTYQKNHGSKKSLQKRNRERPSIVRQMRRQSNLDSREQCTDHHRHRPDGQLWRHSSRSSTMESDKSQVAHKRSKNIPGRDKHRQLCFYGLYQTDLDKASWQHWKHRILCVFSL